MSISMAHATDVHHRWEFYVWPDTRGRWTDATFDLFRQVNALSRLEFVGTNTQWAVFVAGLERDGITLREVEKNPPLPDHPRDVGAERVEPRPWMKTQGHCGRPVDHKGRHEVSTRRKTRSVVHEMAELGVKSLCGRELPEPWEWTDDPTSCKPCLALINPVTDSSKSDHAPTEEE